MCSSLFSRITCLMLLTIPIASPANAESDQVEMAGNPFDNNGDNLPDLGIAPEIKNYEKHLATVAKDFGNASMVDNGLSAREQARQFTVDHIRNALTGRVSHGVESMLSPLGTTQVHLQVDDEGNFTGSRGSLFTPWQDNNRYLTWSQFGVSQQRDSLMGNAGIGQRWVAGDWLLGYNTFYDAHFDESLQRAGVGAEAWGEYLRFSANYYSPLGGWQDSSSSMEQRLARGYDVTAQAWLPFYRHINTSLTLEQYFGEHVDLFNSGTGYHDPMAVNVGLNYTPVPLVTLTAAHKEGQDGARQNNLGLTLNYRFGVPLVKQVSAAEVATSRSLRGSRYDMVERSSVPEINYRQRKTLSVYLATPPWDLKPGETVALKLQVTSSHGIRSLSWQGDTRRLSLTPPARNTSPDGWTVIVPPPDNHEDAQDSWRLAVTLEDNHGQRVTSNVINIKAAEPLIAIPADDSRFSLLPEE